MKLTLRDIKASRIPELIGVCPADTPRIASYVNDAQQRLIFAGREGGWWQGWVKVAFSVSLASPNIVLPAEFARIVNLAFDSKPLYLRNEFYELLPGGPGMIPDSNCKDWSGQVAGYERGTLPTQVEITPTNQKLRVFAASDQDIGKRIFIAGLDQNGNQITSQDGENCVRGFFLTLQAPFVDSGFVVSKITSVVKPETCGDVSIYQVDQTTAEEVLLSRYKSLERNPAYRRYVISPIPPGCCGDQGSCTFTVTAIAKQEFIPVVNDYDALIIGNMPALTEAIQALRYFSHDVAASHEIGETHWKRAIKLLKQELDHYTGQTSPAIAVDQMQGASLDRIGLSTNI